MLTKLDEEAYEKSFGRYDLDRPSTYDASSINSADDLTIPWLVEQMYKARSDELLGETSAALYLYLLNCDV